MALEKSYTSLIAHSLAEETVESARINGAEYAVNELYKMIEEPIKQQSITAYSIVTGKERLDFNEEIFNLLVSAFSSKNELIDTLDEQIKRNMGDEALVDTIEAHVQQLYSHIDTAEKIGMLECLQRDEIESYTFQCSSDEIPCVNCRALNGREYKVSQAKIGTNFPPIHPLCDCNIEVDGEIYKGEKPADVLESNAIEQLEEPPGIADRLPNADNATAESQTDEYGISKNDVFKAWLVKGAEFSGKYEMPALKPCHKKPSQAIPFDKAVKNTKKDQWVHFYIQDRKFECVWNNPRAYLNILKSYEGVISTDFSLYYDMPLAQQVWNTYRNRAFAFWLQQNGVDIIPNVQWGDERSYEFCFDGLPQNSTIAVSTNGCIQGKAERYYFKKGLEEAVKRLTPKVIANYSNTPDDIFLPYKQAGIEIIQIPNWQETVRGRGTV